MKRLMDFEKQKLLLGLAENRYCTHSFQRSKRFLQLAVYCATSSFEVTIKSLGFSYASMECCKCQIKTQIKVFCLRSFTSSSLCSFKAAASLKWIWGLLIAVHKRSLCVMKQSLVFRAQFKVNPDNVLRSHSSGLCCFRFCVFFVRHSVWCGKREN